MQSNADDHGIKTCSLYLPQVVDEVQNLHGYLLAHDGIPQLQCEQLKTHTYTFYTRDMVRPSSNNYQPVGTKHNLE